MEEGVEFIFELHHFKALILADDMLLIFTLFVFIVIQLGISCLPPISIGLLVIASSFSSVLLLLLCSIVVVFLTIIGLITIIVANR